MASELIANVTPPTVELPDTPDELSLVQEANHRISNQLAQLAGQVQRQLRRFEKREDGVSKAEVLLVLNGLLAQISAFGRHHRQLANQPNGEPLELGAFLLENCGASLSHMHLRERVRFVYRLDSACRVSANIAHSLALAMSEIVMNALKYAHPTGLPIIMTVACWRARSRLIVEFSDDGVGLPEGVDPKTADGMGFRILRALAAHMDAELDVLSDSLGLTLRFNLPDPD